MLPYDFIEKNLMITLDGSQTVNYVLNRWGKYFEGTDLYPFLEYIPGLTGLDDMFISPDWDDFKKIL
jgi:hypothetical protein